MAAPRSRKYLSEVVSRRYMIDRLIGEGSFAWVYHARDRDGEEVAVKVLHSRQSTAAVRFAREINVLRSLPANPYIAQYIDQGETSDGRPLLVLEFVDGITLKQGLERKPRLGQDKAVAFLAELCQAFAGLHQLGVAHRDVKPENILLARDGGIKLIDFGLIRDAQGILKLLEEEDQIDSRVFSQDLDRGVLAGTPEYMAPEQFSDSAVEDQADSKTDTHSDVFSLGVILYELLTGSKAFPMRDVSSQEYAKELLRYLRWRIGLRDEDVPRIPDIDQAMSSIVRKAMRRDPRRRQPDCRVLMDDLLLYVETGEGVRDVDEPHTQIVSADSILAAMAAVSGTGSLATSTARPARHVRPVLSDDTNAQEELEASTADLGRMLRPATGAGPEPAGRGHSAPFFDQRRANRRARPFDPTVALVAPESRPRRSEAPRMRAPEENRFRSEGVLPTELVESDDLWDLENLADPPVAGEPDVPTADADAPSLSEEDLFDFGEEDDKDGEDGFYDAVFQEETREVDVTQIVPEAFGKKYPQE